MVEDEEVVEEEYEDDGVQEVEDPNDTVQATGEDGGGIQPPATVRRNLIRRYSSDTGSPNLRGKKLKLS